MKLPFRKEEFLGNIRSGNKRENNSPRNLSYFDVHLDNYTSEFSIELFKNAFKSNPTSLKILPIDNIFVSYEIYSREIKCRGENGIATRITNNQKTEGTCKQEMCQYCVNGKCSKVGRLYFRIAGLENRGIWCYSTRSRGVDYIQRYLDYMIEKNVDITKNYFLLSLNERNGQSGKVYVPDIKLFKENKNTVKNENKKDNNTTNEQGKNQAQNYYTYIKGKMVNYEGSNIPELIFANKEGIEKALYLTKESKKDILKLRPGTVIAITQILEKKENNMIFLKDYKILKAVEKLENTENAKKAV